MIGLIVQIADRSNIFLFRWFWCWCWSIKITLNKDVTRNKPLSFLETTFGCSLPLRVFLCRLQFAKIDSRKSKFCIYLIYWDTIMIKGNKFKTKISQLVDDLVDVVFLSVETGIEMKRWRVKNSKQNLLLQNRQSKNYQESNSQSRFGTTNRGIAFQNIKHLLRIQIYGIDNSYWEAKGNWKQNEWLWEAKTTIISNPSISSIRRGLCVNLMWLTGKIFVSNTFRGLS